jgi:hypothetical protein
MKPLLLKLLTEVRNQVGTVEPHQDMEKDEIAQQNALTLLTYLIMYAEGKADLRPIAKKYFETKIDPESGRSIDEITGNS